MPAHFEEGFLASNQPAWHGLGTVLKDFPGREEAIELAGHNFTIVERPFVDLGSPFSDEDLHAYAEDDNFDKAHVVMPDGDMFHTTGQVEGWRQFRKFMPGHPTHDMLYHVGKDSFTTIQNEWAWDLCDMIVKEGGKEARYESAGVLKQGALCWVLAWLDEPIQIKGDNSPVLPFVCVSWAHDGTGSLKARSTSWRVVCANTEAASEREGERVGTNITIRHTKNAKERIEEVRAVVKGMRTGRSEFVEMANELAKIKVTKTKRNEFVERLVPYPIEHVLGKVAMSDQKKQNIDDHRAAVQRIFESPTVPDAHKFTAYGLRLAGVEFIDHLRGNRSAETKFFESHVKSNPLKARLTGLIKEVTAA